MNVFTKEIAFLLILFFLAYGCDQKEYDYEGDKDSTNLTESFRPRIHFTPSKNWMNDPNGMVYQDGECHLFYQYNPLGIDWGNMSWGHAVSKDLIHWEHLPVALYPDDLGSIFSGSAVIDKNNTAGFGENAMVAIYTSAGEEQTQSIAYSTDGGRSFKKYAHNPVLLNPGINDFRDPKVFWHEESQKWVMSLATHNSITFYGSENLKDWDKLSVFQHYEGLPYGVWECPDLISLEYNGEKKWVLIVSTNGAPNGGTGTQYFVGDFDGETFVPDDAPYPLWLDYGKDNYAGVTWNNTPNGRKIFIGWMSNWQYAGQTPTENFRGANTLPRELTLKPHEDGHLVLASEVVEELRGIAGESKELLSGQVSESTTDVPIEAENAYELNIEINNLTGNGALLKLKNEQGEEVEISYGKENKSLTFDRTNAGESSFSTNFQGRFSSPVYSSQEGLTLKIIVDQSSVEIFINGGKTVQTNLVFPQEIYSQLELKGMNGTFDAQVSYRALSSIWE